MKISAKGRYAVEIMVELAKNNELVSVATLSSRQNIPPKYLEQIINKLVKAKKVISVRGAAGGYRLAKKPKDISIAEILMVTGDMPALAPCLVSDSVCPKKSDCDSIGCWETLNAMIYNYLSKLNLQNLVDKTY